MSAQATKEVAVVAKELADRIPYNVVRRRFRSFYGSRYSPATVVFNERAVDHWMKWPYDNIPNPEEKIDAAYVLKKHPSIDLPQEVYDNRPLYARLYVPDQRDHVINTMIHCEKELQAYYDIYHKTGEQSFDRGMFYVTARYAMVVCMALFAFSFFGMFQFIFEEEDLYKNMFEGTWVDKKKPPFGVRPWDKLKKDPVTGEWTL